MSLLNDLIRAAKAMEREAKRQQQQRIRAEKERQRAIERRQKAREKAARDAEREHKRQFAAEKAAYIQECKDEAKTRTEECQSQIAAIEDLLVASLDISHIPDLSGVKAAFPKQEPRPPRFKAEPSEPESLPLPAKPSEPILPQEPQHDAPAYRKQLGLIRTSRKRKAVQANFEEDHRAWDREVAELQSLHASAISEWDRQVLIAKQEEDRQKKEWKKATEEVQRRNAQLAEQYERAIQEWREEKQSFENAVEQLGSKYTQGEPDAVSAYIEVALSQSPYPEYFPDDIAIYFNPENGQLLIDRGLPSPDMLPAIREVSYVQTRDEFVEKPVAKTQKTQLFDNLVYQVALRTIFEALAADSDAHVQSVVFNGRVETADPATGQSIRPCIASLHASREEFEELDLRQVDPKACFKKLKGVAASKLHQLAPVPPLVRFSKDDDRFVDAREISDDLDQSTNLAAMDWEDFEHLIRELFEAEFGKGESEVKITRASRDRGVDAIAYDPDPIRGGKFVIQAKRYTRTVGVDAVRDLYGTVINEGANKGILVTTAEYGPDAYNFVKDKPLTLVSGGELLFLLEKHGHKARIDLAEAREISTEH
jgi:restriction system protein